MHHALVISSIAVLALAACQNAESAQQPEARAAANEEAGAAESARAVNVAQTRPAVHAGTWYPDEPNELRAALSAMLSRHQSTGDEDVIALVAPHAGLRYSGRVAAAAFSALKERKLDRAFLIGPSHHLAFGGIALPPKGTKAYATPLGDLKLDAEAVESLRGRRGFEGPPDAHLREHSLEMLAIFLAAVQPQTSIVPMVVGKLGDREGVREIGDTVRKLLRPDDVVLVSSDFTHYGASFGYLPFDEQVPRRLRELQDDAYDALASLELDRFENHLHRTQDTICGREPLRMLLAMLPKGAVATMAARDVSGRMTGNYETSVSYSSIVYNAPGGWPALSSSRIRAGAQVLDERQQKLAVDLARSALRNHFAQDGQDATEVVAPRDPVWQRPGAAFVTLKKAGRLRGCIGHIVPVKALWQDIRDNAVAAAIADPRFPAVTREELDELHIEVSVLTPPRPIDSPSDFEVGHHGIILTVNGHRAVFLPQVAPEQGWDRPTTLTHLARKAGLDGGAWRTKAAKLQVFEAQVITEP